MRSRRLGRRARLMTNTWKRRGGRGVGAGGGEGRAHPPPGPNPAGREDLPHQTPSCWASLGAGTHELRPTWGAHALQRKAPPHHESLLALVSGSPGVLAPLVPAPWQNTQQEITESTCLHCTDGQTEAQGEKGLAQSQGMSWGEASTPAVGRGDTPARSPHPALPRSGG